jgi:hypothetical protein
MTPLLPVRDPERFARQLLETGVEHFVVQPFHVGSSRFVAGTRREATELVERLGWDDAAYEATLAVLRERLPRVDIGREGFAPP